MSEVPRELPCLEDPVDVDQILDASEPPSRRVPAGLVLVGLALVIALALQKETSAGLAVLLNMALLVLGGLLVWIMARAAQRHRREQEALATVYQNVQLRQWTVAGTELITLLSRPMFLPQARIQALIYLSAVLGRYQRFSDAARLNDYVLDHAQVDPATDQGLRSARVWALLREDQLVDADRAIVELRRVCGANRSASLAMAELYRDVKTGHAAEALAGFERDLPILRKQLGHRAADAWALAARAAQLLGKPEDARRMARNAMLLGDYRETLARFPEVEPALRLSGDTPLPDGVVA